MKHNDKKNHIRNEVFLNIRNKAWDDAWSKAWGDTLEEIQANIYNKANERIQFMVYDTLRSDGREA